MLCDGRILTWSLLDMRIYDGNSGQCLNILNPKWDVDSGQLHESLEGSTVPIRSAQVLSDGRVIVCSIYGTLQLRDVDNGNCLATLDGHTDSVQGALALAGSRILSWSDDNTLRFWDCNSGLQCVLSIAAL
jgi:WD40 repeat protein